MKYEYGRNPHTVKINGKYYSRVCPKCGSDDKALKSPYCRNCYRNTTKQKKESVEANLMPIPTPELKGGKSLSKVTQDIRLVVSMERSLIEFYERVERRKFQVSLQEIFVEMITLFNFFGKNQTIDLLPAGQQLTFMWRTLELKYDRIKSNPTKIRRPNGAKPKGSRKTYYTESRIDEREYNQKD